MDVADTETGVVPGFLADGGEMGARIAAFDWAATGIGALADWPPSLRAMTSFIVHARLPLALLWGPDGVLIYNDSYAGFIRDKHPGMLGAKVVDAWSEVAEFSANVVRVGMSGGSLTYPNQKLTLSRDGVVEDCWFDLEFAPVFNDHGRPAGVISLVAETTEQMVVQQGLRDSEARLRFLDALDRATLRATDPAEILAITTRRLAEHLGASNCAYADFQSDGDEFIILDDWSRIGSPSTVGRYSLADFGDQTVRELSAGRPLIIHDIHSELPRHNALMFQQIGLFASAVIPLLKNGRLSAMIAVHHKAPHHWTSAEIDLIRDVAERRWEDVARAAASVALRERNVALESSAIERGAALEQSRTQLRLLVQGATDYAIYMLDPQGLITSWNSGAQRIKGYSPQEVMGCHVSMFYTEEGRARGDPQAAMAAARTRGRFVSNGWRVRKNGTRFRASVMIEAVHDDSGQLVGFAKVTRDITEREEAQRELEAAREALFQAQKLEAIGQLTGGVAHDFNNLLMAITSGLTLLRKRLPGDDPKITRLIDNSMKAADRGAALTQRMLAFARRQELKTERVDVAALVADMRGLIERTIGPSWHINYAVPSGLPPVVADANQLEMALLNLSVNARDAMPDGGQIWISASHEHVASGGDLNPGAYVRLSVRDAGTGMDAETLIRATEPFFTTKGVGKGTGLGLSMIDGFARQNGGKMDIQSRLGTGTTAHIWLPVSSDATALPLAPVAETLSDPAEDAALIVLVVDDDPLVLMNTADLLTDLGHRVIEAASGAIALKQLEARDDIALLVTDQAMPGMTGSELIAHARQLRPELPIILASGYGETPVDVAARLIRLHKPFTQAELQRAISHILQLGITA